MATRLALHEQLCSVLGSTHVYYQPPSTVKMVYPCIVYSLSKDRTKYADDTRYSVLNQYTVTIIDRNPDSITPSNLSNALRYCTFDRTYMADNLNHFVFIIYF